MAMNSRSIAISLPLLAAALLAPSSACDTSPPEIPSSIRSPSDKGAKSSATPGSTATGSAAATTTAAAATTNGPIDLATATAAIPGTGALIADMDTELGKLSCKLLDDLAPKTVANFVGLARGLQAFKDPSNGSQWTKRPAYDGVVFHRIIKGFMIQGGDPSGTGSGEPGYVIPDEIWPGAKHDRAGLLCMANRGANTNGMQWFITDDAAPHLDKSYTIFGECAPVAVVHKIAGVPVGSNGETPVTKPRILSVKIRHEKP